MNRRMMLLTGLALTLCTFAVRTEAKDRFYYLGQRSIQVIDGDTDAIVADIPIKGWSRESALTADKKSLYVSTSRHWIHKVDLEQNKVVATADVSGDGWERFMFGFSLDADGKTGYASLISRKTENGEAVIGKPVVAQIDLETGKLLRSVEVPWGVAHLVTVKGGKMVYALGKDLYKIDTSGSDMKIAETMPMYEKKWNILPFWDYAWENGGVASMPYYTPEFMGLLLVDGSSGAVTDIPLKGDPIFAYSVVLSPDKKKGYAVMDDVSVIDVAGKKYGPSVPMQEGTSYGVNISSDGKKVYVGGAGSTLSVYDAATLKLLKVLQMASDGMDIRRVTF